MVFNPLWLTLRKLFYEFLFRYSRLGFNRVYIFFPSPEIFFCGKGDELSNNVKR